MTENDDDTPPTGPDDPKAAAFVAGRRRDLGCTCDPVTQWSERMDHLEMLHQDGCLGRQFLRIEADPIAELSERLHADGCRCGAKLYIDHATGKLLGIAHAPACPWLSSGPRAN